RGEGEVTHLDCRRSASGEALLGGRDEDAAGEECGDPERQPVGLSFEGTGERGDNERRAADAAPRPVAPTPGNVLVPARHRRCLCPDLSPALCYISRASSSV